MTVPSDSTYDASVHLSVADIAVDNSKFPSVVSVRIKASLGKTGSSVCPVAAILSYLCVRGIAAATTAAANGNEDSIIKTLGR